MQLLLPDMCTRSKRSLDDSPQPFSIDVLCPVVIILVACYYVDMSRSHSQARDLHTDYLLGIHACYESK